MEEDRTPNEGEAPSGDDAPTPASSSAAEGAVRPAPRSRSKRRDGMLFRAYRSGLPLDGKVESVIKGGYEVRISKSRGFCPHSQMDVHRIEDPENLVGRTLSFRVTQIRRGGNDVIVSHRAVLEEERSEEAKAVRATLIEGAVTQGKVVRVAAFGAFVDLGAGVTGLVHVSELSHSRVQDVTEAAKVGDWVSVKILSLKNDGRISLSMRQTEEDPWSGAGDSFRQGERYPGTVRRMTDFGAFVELRPGVEALAPAREFPPSTEAWSHGLEPGTEREWLVIAIDVDRRRITIIPAPEAGTPVAPTEIEAGMHLDGKVQKVESFGVFVWLAPGRVGLLPNVWTGVPRGGDVRKKFRTGAPVRVEVVEVSEGGRRIRLAVEGARREERAAPRAKTERPRRREPTPGSHDESPASPPSTFGSTLADALRAALDNRDTGSS